MSGVAARAGVSWRWLALLTAVALAVVWRGGYADNARGAVTALAALAVVGALWWVPDAAGRSVRAPVVTALTAVAAVTAISAAWTIGEPADAFGDAISVLALAAIVVAAATLPGPWNHAIILLLTAVGCAWSGIVATLAALEPYALEICGSWRPAGPFEYPPALALVCAGALPVAVAATTTGRRWLSLAGLGTGWLLGLTVALTANRTGIALAALALTSAVALAPRNRAAGPQALGLIVAVTASTLILRGELGDASTGRTVVALVPLVALMAGSSVIASGGGASRRWIAIVAIVALAATVGGVLADRGGPCGGDRDASHGRTDIWRAGVGTGMERPLTGFGAGTFMIASRDRQLEYRPRPTAYAHDLPLETWVELGIVGLVAVLAWYAATAQLVLRTIRAAAPERESAWLFAPAVVAFPLANLLDWPWELLGAGALWAVATGCLIGHRAVGPASGD
ncbi:MAG: O-antigen ligase family protein [Solirubrobacterales bacterium]